MPSKRNQSCEKPQSFLRSRNNSASINKILMRISLKNWNSNNENENQLNSIRNNNSYILKNHAI